MRYSFVCILPYGLVCYLTATTLLPANLWGNP